MFTGKEFLKKKASSSEYAPFPGNNYLAPNESILVEAFKKRISAATTHRELYRIAKEASEQLDKDLIFGAHTYGPYRAF